MSESFIKDRLEKIHGLKIIVPTSDVQEEIQQRIYGDLSVGSFNREHRNFILTVCDRLVQNGAGAVILGCTELPLLLEESSTSVAFFNPQRTHCHSIVRIILNQS